MKRYRIDEGEKFRLSDFDPRDTSELPNGKKQAEKKSASIQAELDDLQDLFYAARRHKLLIILQGMDASGKDGTVRPVMGGFAPAGVEVVSFKKPTQNELD